MSSGVSLSTRFDARGRSFSLLCLLCLLALIAMGAECWFATPKGVGAMPGRQGDGALYARIVDRVAMGESYYAAATALQRARNYPLHPAVTVREPTLALLLAALPGVPARRGLFISLALSGLILWGWRLQVSYHQPLLTAWGLFCLSFACMFGFFGDFYLLHECWAGLLLLMAFAFHDAAHAAVADASGSVWLGGALLCALAAVLIRELAAPFLLVMVVVALAERRWREAMLWALTVVVFTGFMLLHVRMLAPYVLPSDGVSPGWAGMHGWAELLGMMSWNGLCISVPWLAIVQVPLMGLGAAGWPGHTGNRVMLLCLGYSIGFCLFGRPDTSYWGLVAQPLFGLGLVWAPQSLWRLTRGVWGA